MGALLSYLRDLYHGINGLLATISESSHSFDAALARITSPRLPSSNPTTSFWQQQPPYPELVNMRSDKLPASADIVIIGSGMSGASIAHTVLNECRSMGISTTVVMLEGRTICSGATGRNGGHIKVAPLMEYAKFKGRFGATSAKKILAFYMKHLPFILQLAKKEGIDKGEAREVQAVDAITDLAMLSKVKEMREVLKEDLPEIGERIDVLDEYTIQNTFGFSSQFHGGVSYLSGAMWPYRFVTSIYASLLESFPDDFSIETGTMVEAIQVTSDPDTPFLLNSSRGDIQAAQVVHATDGFVANLIPGLVGKAFPIRGHMSAQRAGKSFPNYNGEISWSFVGSKGYDYVSQRPGLPDTVDGLGAEIMIGGGTFHGDGTGIGEVGQWGDDAIVHPIGAYLAGVLPVSFSSKLWGEDANGSNVKNMWTGIMGFTADMMPLIGRLSPTLTKRPLPKAKPSSKPRVQKEPEPSEWISAGFHGSGMVLTWLSGVATGLMVLGRENVASDGQHWRPEGVVNDWLPDEFVCSPERVSRSSIYEFPKLL